MNSRFPRSTTRACASIAKAAHCQHFEDGETLFRAGERDFKFFVIKKGKVEIVDVTGDTPKTIVVHEAVNSPGTSRTSPATLPL